MNVHVSADQQALGAEAARRGAMALVSAIERNGSASMILATGASQFATIEHLREKPDIDWSKVTVFHLDEYAGMLSTHPASFVRYLDERFRQYVPSLKEFVFIDGTASDLDEECERLSDRIAGHQIDVAFIGIGENGHLAFNDPPADFETTRPYIVVDLDDACRQQQLSEGWFPTLEDVPKKAISMSVHRILQSRLLIVSVPDSRKGSAVRCAVEGPVSNLCPASALQRHADCSLFLDDAAASLLER